MPDAPARAIPQLRHALRSLLPPWLKRPIGDSFLAEGLFTLYDLDAEYMRAALLLRFPSYSCDDALPLLLADRGLPVCIDEDPDTMRARGLLWLDVLQMQGLPLGLLLLIQALLSYPGQPPAYSLVRLVTQASLWYELDDAATGRFLGLEGFDPLPLTTYEGGAFWPAGTEASRMERLRLSDLYARVNGVNNWDWDSLSVVAGTGYPGCTWLILYSVAPNSWVEPDTEWGTDGQWGDGGAWGVDVSPAIGQIIAATARRMKSARSWIRSIIVSFTGSLFDPNEASGGGINPDGYFGRWAKIVPGTGWVASRFAAARYSGEVR